MDSQVTGLVAQMSSPYNASPTVQIALVNHPDAARLEGQVTSWPGGPAFADAAGALGGAQHPGGIVPIEKSDERLSRVLGLPLFGRSSTS